MKQLIFHSAFTPNTPRVTVGAVIKDGQAHFGVSRCSENDQFVKKVGAQRALGRASSRKPVAVFDAPSTDLIKWFVTKASVIAQQAIEVPRLRELQ